MKSILKPLNIVSIVVFIALILCTMYYLYFMLPTAMVEAIKTDQPLKGDFAQQINKATEIALPVVILVGAVLIVGLGVVVVFVASDRYSTGENIIYVEKFVDRRQEKSSETEFSHTISHQDKIADIKKQIQEKKSAEEKLNLALCEICRHLKAVIGAAFLTRESEGRRFIEFASGYAYQLPDSKTLVYEYGEGIAGQVAKEGKIISINAVPQGYISVLSGLGNATPSQMVVAPVKNNEQVKAVMEIASFTPFTAMDINFIQEITDLLSTQIIFEPLTFKE